jgi:anthranilate phosphoribosyltransferase
MDIQAALAQVVEGQHLERDAMVAVMRQIMSGDATDAQIGALLVALRIKGETIDEIAGAATVMRDMATPVNVRGPHLVDLVGTGGDGANLFNVSTASCFVVAAGGAQVAKHGNRSVSSTSGSSDVLEALGVPLDLSPDQVARCHRRKSVLASCLRRRTTAPCAMRSARDASSGCARCSTCSAP